MTRVILSVAEATHTRYSRLLLPTQPVREMREIVRGAGRGSNPSGWNKLATLQQIIAEKFLSKLAEDKAIDARKVEALRALLQKGQKLKVDDFVKIFTTDAGDLA